MEVTGRAEGLFLGDEPVPRFHAGKVIEKRLGEGADVVRVEHRIEKLLQPFAVVWLTLLVVKRSSIGSRRGECGER